LGGAAGGGGDAGLAGGDAGLAGGVVGVVAVVGVAGGAAASARRVGMGGRGADGFLGVALTTGWNRASRLAGDSHTAVRPAAFWRRRRRHSSWMMVPGMVVLDKCEVGWQNVFCLR
jgi:hypothetical protein